MRLDARASVIERPPVSAAINDADPLASINDADPLNRAAQPRVLARTMVLGIAWPIFAGTSSRY